MRPSLARRATELVARDRERRDGAPTPLDPRFLDAMEARIRSRAARRLRLRYALVASLVAAASVVFLLLPRSSEPAPRAASAPPPLVTAKVERSGEEPKALARGEHVVTSDGTTARLALSTGTVLLLDEHAELGVDALEREQRFFLVSGKVRADVAKLARDERFLVRTADVEVEVRGTSFEVTANAAPCASSTTRVSVREGVVSVRFGGSETRLVAGDHWPAACDLPIAPAPPPVPSQRPRVTAPATSVPAPSVLGDENRAFGEATSARLHRSRAEAIASYEAFIARYPKSNLVETATVERMRLLAASDRTRARAAAIEYLAHWPDGYAREEATALSGGSP